MEKPKTTEELDALHDSGAAVAPHIDAASHRRSGRETRRVNVDFPSWMVASLDREAERLGVTRQSVIKIWVASHFEDRSSPLGPNTSARYSEIRKFIEHEMTVAEAAAKYGNALAFPHKAKRAKGRAQPRA